MFNSKGNNFGAGVISFKDVQERNYVVLNARFTCSPQNPEYRAAEVLEIHVPALSIDRSAEAGVIARFKDRMPSSYGTTRVYDGGTVLRSWIRDANTLCIEKLPVFDDRDELVIYVQALYCQLGQGGNAVRSKARRINCLSDGGFLRLDSAYTFCVVFDRWIFYHMMYVGCAYAMQEKDWDAYLENLPEDVAADVPVICSDNYQHTRLGTVTESRIEDGYFTFPADERDTSFFNSSNYVFSFAYLVRDSEPESELGGRLRIAEEELRGAQSQVFRDFDLELIPVPALAACSGSTGMYGSAEETLTAPSCPDGMPDFRAYFLCTGQQYPGLAVHMFSMELTKDSGTASVKLTDRSGMNNLAFIMHDTAVATAF